MDYNILQFKPTWTHGSEDMMDLFAPTYVGGTVGAYLIEVTEDYVARPDLVSLAVYGTDEYADVICKYNGISNPFELNEGMELTIPFLSDVNTLLSLYPAVSKYAEPDDTAAFTPKTFAKKKTDKRAPNQILEGQRNYYYSEDLGIALY